MGQKFRIEGLKELDKALGQLPRATGKNVLRRVARKVLQPIIDDARGKAGEVSGDLKRSMAVSPKLSHRQKTLHVSMFANKRSSIEMFGGAGAHTFVGQAVWTEFGVKRGSKKTTPHPFLRPAWDAGKIPMLNNIKQDLWFEIKKSADRVARKRARALKKAGR